MLCVLKIEYHNAGVAPLKIIDIQKEEAWSWVDRELGVDLERVGGGETMVRICCMKIFQLKKGKKSHLKIIDMEIILTNNNSS